MTEMRKYKRMIGTFIVLGILGSGTLVWAGPPLGPFHGFVHGPG